MPSPAASVEARAVMIETWAHAEPDAATAEAGPALTATRTRPAAPAAATAMTRRRTGVGFTSTNSIRWMIPSVGADHPQRTRGRPGCDADNGRLRRGRAPLLIRQRME